MVSDEGKWLEHGYEWEQSHCWASVHMTSGICSISVYNLVFFWSVSNL